MFSKSYLSFLIATLLGATAAAQELPAEVMDNYAAFQTAASENDWSVAAAAITQAAEAGDRLGIDAASRMVLWENAGVAHRRAGDFPAAEDALEAALTISRDSGDASTEVRLLSRLVDVEIDSGDGEAAMDRLDDFEDAVARSGVSHPDLERRMLAIRLVSTEPGDITIAAPLTEQNRARAERLLGFSEPGSAEDAIARRRLIIDAAVGEDWQGALDQLFEAMRVLPEPAMDTLEDDDPFAELLHLFNRIVSVGFGDIASDGSQYMAEDLRPVWCAYLGREPVVSLFTEPRYVPAMLEQAVEADVFITYAIDHHGNLIEAEYEARGEHRRVDRFIEPSREAFERSRWRPQCDPQEGGRIEGDREYQFRLY